MRKLWKYLFVMPSKHRTGYLQLLFLAFIFLLLKVISKQVYSPKPISLNNVNIDSVLNEINRAVIQESEKTDSLFHFDPNSVSLNNLISLGISEEISLRIIKYRSKGGRFYETDDLLKIYGFEKELYEDLQEFISITERKDLRNRNIHHDYSDEKPKISYEQKTLILDEKKTILSFDINTADSTNLMELYGIGPVISSSIITYRNKLGGFVSLNQITEVYNMNMDRFEEIKKYCYIDDNYEPQKVSINNVSFKTLLRHPYFDYNTVKNLFNYKDQHGEFTSINDLKNLYFMTDSLFSKVEPYLSL